MTSLDQGALDVAWATFEPHQYGTDTFKREGLHTAITAYLAATQPALAVKDLDTVAVAHEIAKRIATSGKTGRVHQIVYDAATEGALEALALVTSPPPSGAVEALQEILALEAKGASAHGKWGDAYRIAAAALSTAPATAEGWRDKVAHPDQTSPMTVGPEAFFDETLSSVGWKMVPVEPTDEMLCVASDAADGFHEIDGDNVPWLRCAGFAAAYRAMIAAAPTATGGR